MALVDEGVVNNNEIVDIDLSTGKKQRFRIDRDNNRIIELNTSDMTIIHRIRDIYSRLTKLAREAVIEQHEDTSEEGMINEASDTLKQIDTQMRDLIDELFDSKVADICVPSGSLFDLHNGEFVFETIINKLSGLYESNITNEIKKLDKRLSKHTSKYTGKK